MAKHHLIQFEAGFYPEISQFSRNIFINPRYVYAVREKKDGTCFIFTQGEAEPFLVKGSGEETLKRLGVCMTVTTFDYN